jgi:hypothetical protein
MAEFKFRLEAYSGIKSRYTCPNCNKPRTFTRYINSESGEHIDPSVGRCSRENKCGYHHTPKQHFQENKSQLKQRPTRPLLKPKQPNCNYPPSHIQVSIFKASLTTHESNNFIKFLAKTFGGEITNKLIGRYFIASSKYWNGATVFWQIDVAGNIRTGKVMLYDPANGKRIKEPYNHINWVHAVLKLPNFHLQQCLYGEWLLEDKTRPVAIVESEKTAIISSVYFPQFLWLAAGSLTNLSEEKCQVLKNRRVVLFPDVKGYDKWKLTAQKLTAICKVTVSDLLEISASEKERQDGLDLADYLLRFDYKDFKNIQPVSITPEIALTNPFPEIILQPSFSTQKQNKNGGLRNIKVERPFDAPTNENWTPEIQELESFFLLQPPLSSPVMLDECSKVDDLHLFVRSHLAIVNAYSGQATFKPYLFRLQQMRTLLLSMKNKS